MGPAHAGTGAAMGDILVNIVSTLEELADAGRGAGEAMRGGSRGGIIPTWTWVALIS